MHSSQLKSHSSGCWENWPSRRQNPPQPASTDCTLIATNIKVAQKTMSGKRKESGKQARGLLEQERASTSADGTEAQQTHRDHVNNVNDAHVHAGVEDQKDDGKSDPDNGSMSKSNYPSQW